MMSDQKDKSSQESTDTPKKRNRSTSSQTPPDLKKETKKVKHQHQELAMDKIESMDKKIDSYNEDVKKMMHMLSNCEERSNEVKDVVNSVKDLSESFKNLHKEIKLMKKDFASLKNIKGDIDALRMQNNMLHKRVNELEDYSRRENITISGMPERRGENCFDICHDHLHQFFDMGMVEIVGTHRLGDPRDNKRPIIMRFRHYEDKMAVMHNLYQLKGSNIYFNDPFSDETMRQHQSLYPLLKEMKKIDPKAQLKGAKIQSKGRLYDIHNTADLPISPHNATTITKSNITLFSGRFSNLSNLHPVQLEIDNRVWGSVEQYYQFHKALDSNYAREAQEILVQSDPVEAMVIGRRVKASPEWIQTRGPEVMKKAQLVKFQIPAMAFSLKSCGLYIGEATKNPVWGTGKTLSDNNAFQSSSWTGSNKAGEMLKEVRQLLKLNNAR